MEVDRYAERGMGRSKNMADRKLGRGHGREGVVADDAKATHYSPFKNPHPLVFNYPRKQESQQLTR